MNLEVLTDMKQKLSMALTLLLLSGLCLSSCRAQAELGGQPQNAALPASLMRESEDLGQAYLDSFIFFGESTTYHLKSRGVLSGGVETHQVWGPTSGTVNLDTTVGTLKIVYPPTGEQLTIGEAVRHEQPRRILLCFGLNGAVGNIRRGKEYFQSCYRTVIDAIQRNSPTTEIFLQSAFPVAKNMDMTHFSVDVDTLNAYIRTINEWSAALASEYGLGYLNTAECLCDEQGRLRIEYQNGDGHHLTAEAYQKILYYIRTHGKE